MLYIKLFIEREKNTCQSAPECPFKRKDIYRHSWICNDGYTRKELDHILTNDRSFFKSIRVFTGAEPPANSDHRLVVATAALRPYRATRKSG